MLARPNDVCVKQYSRSSKLHRSRVLLRKWLLWWQHKTLKLKIFCCDSRLRLLKMTCTVVALLALVQCLKIIATWDFSNLYVVFLFLFCSWFTWVCAIICAVLLLMFDILCKVTAHACG